MTDSNPNGRGWYNHRDYDESQVLKACVKTDMSKHANEDDLFLAMADADDGEFAGETPAAKARAKSKAHRQLWGIVAGHIKLESLISHISTNHEDDGHGALEYILGCFAAGANVSKLKAADKEYKTIERNGIPPDATVDEANAVLTKMSNLRDSLRDSSYEYTDMRHSRNLIHIVENRGKAHAQEVRMQDALFNAAALRHVTKIAGLLDGVMRAVDAAGGEEGSEKALRAMLIQCGRCTTEAQATVMVANIGRGIGGGGGGGGGGDKKVCPHCKIWHQGEWKDCHALALSRGQTPPRWAEKTPDMRKRIADRAEAIAPGCMAKHSISVLICAPKAASGPKPSPDAAAAVDILVDTQANPSGDCHFIRDLPLFDPSTMHRLEEPIAIGGVGTGQVVAAWAGSVKFYDVRGRTYVMNDCVYVPEFPANVINPVLLEKHGTEFNFGARELRVADGGAIQLERERVCFSAVIVPGAWRNAQVALTETVQRGAHGKLHVDVDAMTGAERALFDLQMARCNDLSLGRAQSLPGICDGVPDILRKANAVNTATPTRMLADPPMSPPVKGSTPVAERPGQLTQTDLWKGPTVSLMGNSYMSTQYDSHSTHFEVYPMKKKSEAPAVQDRYFTWAKARGVDIDRGGVLYSDNEIVLNSVAFNAVAAKHNQSRANSVEYTPTGNSGAESTFRILPNEMRKMMIRAGVPDEFWDFAALDAAFLMAATRERDGVSVGTKFDGRRRDISRRRVWGCLVVAKLPAPWVQSNTTARGVEGINLGKARGKPGWWVWSPEYGLLTSKHVTFYETRFPFKDGTFALHSSSRSTGGTGGGGVSFAPTEEPTAQDDEPDDDNNGGGGGHGGGGAEDDDDDDDDAPGLAEAEEDDDDDVELQSQAESGSGPARSASVPASSRCLDTEDEYRMEYYNEESPDDSKVGTDAEISSSNASDYFIRVLLSSVKKADKQREQREEGIPPPWRPLKDAPKHIQELFGEAEAAEINGILDTGAAYEVRRIDLPDDEKICDTHTLRDIKKNGPKKGKPKVRVVADKGPPGVESHSPTVQMATLRALLAVMAAKRAKGAGGDFPQAYLNAEQTVYHVYPPKSARQYDEDGNRLVWALPRALYGGRASGRHWYMLLRKWFVDNGFVVSEWDPCLFVKRNEDGTFHYVAVYVDDLVHVYTDEEGYRSVIDKFKADFLGYSDLGPLNEIFNAEIDCSEQFITLTQTRYIEALAETWLPEAETYKTYTPALVDLQDVVKTAAESTVGKLSEEDHAVYRAIVGAILYVSTVCRPDISNAVGLLSRVLEHPTETCLLAAMRVLRYLRTTKMLGLRWTVGSDVELSGMSDSDWAVVKSTSGYIFFMAQAAIAYIAKKQASTAMSSTEAEIMAASLAALEAIFLRGMLGEVGCKQKGPTVIGVDNQGAIALAKNYISNSRTKHIERRHLKIRELTEEFVVRPEFVPTDENVADIMTKPLGRVKFEKFRKMILNHEL